MTATKQEVAADWLEQWRAYRVGAPAPILHEMRSPHGRVRIHGPQDQRGRCCVATFVRDADGAVAPLGTGDYASCADACVGVLAGWDAVWDSTKFPQ